MYRYHTEGYYDKIVIVAGCVQTVLYLDFFYLYATKGMRKLLPTTCQKCPFSNFVLVMRGKRLTLPTTVDKI